MTRAITEKGRAAQQVEKDEKRRKRERANMWRMVLEWPAGRAVLGELMDELLNRDVWAGNAEIQKNAVMHDIGRMIEQKIREIDPGVLLLMAQERHAESLAADIRLEKHEENEEENEENVS